MSFSLSRRVVFMLSTWRAIHVIIWIHRVVIKCFDSMSNFNSADGYPTKVAPVCNTPYVRVFLMLLWNLALDS